MPKCVKCGDFFPPNYTEVVPGFPPDADGNYPQQCIFCKLNVQEVEREESRGSNKFVKYTKKQCIEDYKRFLNRMKHMKAKDILKKGNSIV